MAMVDPEASGGADTPDTSECSSHEKLSSTPRDLGQLHSTQWETDPNSPSRHADNLSMRIDEPTHGYMATITEDEALPKALALMHLKKIPNRKRIRAAN